MAVDINQLNNQISRKVSGYKTGYFVTVDSRYTTHDFKIDGDFMRQFGNNEVKAIADGIGVYCCGFRYLLRHNSCKVISSIEIGRGTNRLHAHLMILHHGESYRTAEQAKERLRSICEPTVNMLGASAIDVRQFNAKCNWIEYFTKDTQFMNGRYGFTNIDMY